MKTKEIMNPRPQTVSPQAPIQEAAAKMRDMNIGCLLVCDDDRLLGLVTDRDIVTRGVAANPDCTDLSVREVMTEGPIYCFEDQDVEEVARIMEVRSVRRIAVLNGNKRLVGLLSLDDVAQESFLAGEILSVVSNSKMARMGKKAA